MAIVIPCKKPQLWEFDASEAEKPGGERAQDKLFADLQDKSDKVDLVKCLRGLVVSFPFADGLAHYKVVKDVKDTPLVLEHIPYGDAWRLHGYAESGLQRPDIIGRATWCRQHWVRRKRTS